GPQGPEGKQGAQGQPGSAGTLALDCLVGQLPRWNGSDWECSHDGAALLPEPVISPEIGGCRFESCDRPVLRVTLGDNVQPSWDTFGGGSVRTFLTQGGAG